VQHSKCTRNRRKRVLELVNKPAPHTKLCPFSP
jgi:hypothetical protein